MSSNDLMSSAPTRSKVALKGSSRTVAEFFEYSINSILYQRGIYPAEDFQLVRKYDLNVLVTLDSNIKAYIKRIIAQLHKWLLHGKIRKLVVAIVDKDTSEAVELWQFDVDVLNTSSDYNIHENTSNNNNNNNHNNNTGNSRKSNENGKENDENHNNGGNPSTELHNDYSTGRIKDQKANTQSSRSPKSQHNDFQDTKSIQQQIQAIIRQITASITFLPVLQPGMCTFNVQVYANEDAQVPGEWADSEARMVKNAEQVQLRSLVTGNHQVNTVVAYRLGDDL